MLNRLSGPSFRFRVGLAVAMLASAGMSIFVGWTTPALIVGVVCGIVAAVFAPKL